jgi:hypothetical protein
LRLSVGAALLGVGVLGAFLPILQGWIFFLAGLSVMAPESPRARRALDWAKARLRRGVRKTPSGESHPSRGSRDGERAGRARHGLEAERGSTTVARRTAAGETGKRKDGRA